MPACHLPHIVALTACVALIAGCRSAPPNACPLAPVPEPHLRAGASTSVWIDSQNERTRTGLRLDSTAMYRIRGEGKWIDGAEGSIPSRLHLGLDSTSARGYRPGEQRLILRPWLYVVRWITRVRGAPLYALVGELSTRPRDFFTIGDSIPSYRPAATGALVVFANDVKHFYHNNRGCMRLVVDRLE